MPGKRFNDISEAVSYDGDLTVAAMEVIAELDDVDGIQKGTKAFRVLVRDKSREHKVAYLDLMVRVMECSDD